MCDDGLASLDEWDHRLASFKLTWEYLTTCWIQTFSHLEVEMRHLQLGGYGCCDARIECNPAMEAQSLVIRRPFDFVTGDATVSELASWLIGLFDVARHGSALRGREAAAGIDVDE